MQSDAAESEADKEKGPTGQGTTKPNDSSQKRQRTESQSGDYDISQMFAQSGKATSASNAKGATAKGNSSKSSATREFNKSDTIATEAAQLMQSFDDPGAIFGITEKKLEDMQQKVKGLTFIIMCDVSFQFLFKYYIIYKYIKILQYVYMGTHI